MSKLNEVFQNKKAFIPFITAGDPALADTERFILEMEAAGADLIEIGIPFSDPVAEGPVIQEADLRALASGTTVEGIFEMVASLRKKSGIPLVFMTYANPVYHYGFDDFLKRCAELNVGGVIIPDLPYEEQDAFLPISEKYAVELISMVAPTSEERISMIAKRSKGFLYVVSSLGVTGMREKLENDLQSMINQIRQVTDTPCAIGVVINTPEQAGAMAKIADGVIVGSAIVKIVEEYGSEAAPKLREYVEKMKAAMA